MSFVRGPSSFVLRSRVLVLVIVVVVSGAVVVVAIEFKGRPIMSAITIPPKRTVHEHDNEQEHESDEVRDQVRDNVNLATPWDGGEYAFTREQGVLEKAEKNLKFAAREPKVYFKGLFFVNLFCKRIL